MCTVCVRNGQNALNVYRVCQESTECTECVQVCQESTECTECVQSVSGIDRMH